jgi:hypothetical protein
MHALRPVRPPRFEWTVVTSRALAEGIANGLAQLVAVARPVSSPSGRIRRRSP